MEELQAMLYFFVGIWFWINRSYFEKCKKRLEAIESERKGEDIKKANRKIIAEKRKKLMWAILRSDDVGLVRRRKQRRQILQFVLNRRSAPSVWAVNRATEWWEFVVPGFTDAQWVQNFRMSEETFLYLCHKLRPAMERRNTNFRLCVPLNKRIAMALWKLATNSKYRCVSHLFGVGITTVWRCVGEFCAAVEEILVPELIQLPTQEKLVEMADYFEQRWGVPQCVGAIDGSHIPILAPKEYHCEFLNRKGWHSIILQAIVDGKGLFWNVCTGLPGSMHDARVLRVSKLWELASSGNLFSGRTRNIGGSDVDFYLLGDAAYPLQSWLLKPFPDNGQLTEEQQLYNIKTSSARLAVENAFGRLKGRWRCLIKRNDCDLNLVKSMVISCCALHNLCESHGENYRQEWSVHETPEPPLVALSQRSETEGLGVREGLMRYFSSL